MPRAEDDNVLRRALLDRLELLEDGVDGEVGVLERRRAAAAAAKLPFLDARRLRPALHGYLRVVIRVCGRAHG